ncbi:hypothetical protein G7081_02515 [Vagococcus coleopterorum]|uniref:Uncharacterized protein n=1 Tax=Vagococcus coleopterorum TaxID=2714946 RepID=A0A6G8ALT8_9ENTE|nr:hypothetical protein [Vagococcus coleopterorum]QIL46041.1 hypothetical protein G7081_02515 [Vagococcus coleopterorum]
MVANIIFWAFILINIAWIIISTGFSIYYLINKENGNLWAFGFLNIVSAIVLALVLLVYTTWNFNVTTQFSLNLIYVILGAEVVLAIIKFILGREPKLETTK